MATTYSHTTLRWHLILNAKRQNSEPWSECTKPPSFPKKPLYLPSIGNRLLSPALFWSGDGIVRVPRVGAGQDQCLARNLRYSRASLVPCLSAESEAGPASSSRLLTASGLAPDLEQGQEVSPADARQLPEFVNLGDTGRARAMMDRDLLDRIPAPMGPRHKFPPEALLH